MVAPSSPFSNGRLHIPKHSLQAQIRPAWFGVVLARASLIGSKGTSIFISGGQFDFLEADIGTSPL
jgi:hypothetical protein